MASQHAPAIARAGLPRTALLGKVVIITGGGGGIGREVARACAWLGARVVVAELSPTGHETVALIAAAGGDAQLIPTDVADEGAVADLVARTLARYGPPDALINNATLNRPAPLVESSLALFERTLAVNLRGPFLTMRAVLPHLLARGQGLIVNMVSTGALPTMGAYFASKQGLLGLTQSLAAELGEGEVRVVALAPGLVDTPGLRDAANTLAPRLGLTPGHILNASPHPAYEGAIPAEDAGAAVAYLVATGGAGFHGDLVTGYALLERAGLISPLVTAAPDNDCPCGIGEAAHLARVLSAQIHRLLGGAEAAQLPLFARLPLARNRLRACTGLSFDEWEATIGDLERQLARLEQDSAPAPTEGLHIRLERLFDGLMHLRDYYTRVPEETARYSADQELLREVGRVSARRVQLIDELISALRRV